MKGSILLALALGAALGGTANASDPAQKAHKADAHPAHPAHAPHWTYSGKTGASHWGELQAGFEACSVGREQSPIDIRGASAAELPPLAFDYSTSSAEIVNNGHTIQIDLPQGGMLRLPFGAYRLLQFHFHAPSEEKIEGKAYPMVAHMVHRDEQGRIAVVAVLFREGRENAALARVFAAMPAHEGGKASLAGGLDPAQLLPPSRGYWAFMGSLTTPPCTEGVRWQVLKDPVEVSKAQLAAFRKLYPMNARPVQPLNGRSLQVSS